MLPDPGDSDEELELHPEPPIHAGGNPGMVTESNDSFISTVWACAMRSATENSRLKTKNTKDDFIDEWFECVDNDAQNYKRRITSKTEHPSGSYSNNSCRNINTNDVKAPEVCSSEVVS